MKKGFALVIALMMLISLIGCGKQQSTGGDANQANGDSKARVLRIGTTAAPDGHYVRGLEVFKEKVEEYSNNQVEVQIFHSSQLGNERDLVEGVALGTIEMAISSSGPLPNFSSDFMLFDLPFIITDRDKAYDVMDGAIGQEILATLEPSGIKALGFWENGFRHITNSAEPIVHPEDVRGMKVRTMENPIHIETFRHLGATATPMAWSEVFTALQQGVIDGQENPLVILETANVYEVQKNVSLTGHFYSPAVVMINQDLFNSFSPEIQEAILKAENEARDWQRDYSRSLDESLIETLRGRGMVVTEVDSAEWQQAVMPVYDKFTDQINADYIKALTE
ncbi:TRAP transporter substrate-binding protein [Clostridium formicaceticum]|uniref:2,3-diketo-L-gulonate-binding periplasmic protein YiaO n=1 Tax=Clostridium formicaceticum TaxID=1497 RepID=A0AAC9RPN6_9CLOT|nr:TRAP transporter substrate-binding protein [Clostridium formicaceticum]AOY74975.1 C4-dicarboxylate ABC transporter substrate-binding protein [Clostridium formicaceticum]ARE89387.1 2,3-diketo-L-gulonate-binding periplasmic protein YiaO precursor [Clostridium formicaceticum]